MSEQLENVPQKQEQPKVDPNKALKEQVKEYIDTLATQKALANNELANEITEKKRQELSLSADTQLKAEQVQSKKAQVTIQEAQYGVFEGVAKYAGISHPLPTKMQQIVFCFLSVLQAIVLILFGTPISIINITIEQVDSVVNKLNSVAKSVRRIVLSSILIIFIAIIVLIIYKFVG